MHVFLCQAADRRDVVCHLIGRGCGMTRVQCNVQCAQAAPSGKLVVIKLHARFHFGCVGFETWSRTQLGHTQSFTHKHIILSRASFKHNFITHNSSHTTFFKLIDAPPPPSFFLSSPSRFNFCFCSLEEVDLWGFPVL